MIRKNKKRIDPRYFLNETATRDLNEAVPSEIASDWNTIKLKLDPAYHPSANSGILLQQLKDSFKLSNGKTMNQRDVEISLHYNDLKRALKNFDLIAIANAEVSEVLSILETIQSKVEQYDEWANKDNEIASGDDSLPLMGRDLETAYQALKSKIEGR